MPTAEASSRLDAMSVLDTVDTQIHRSPQQRAAILRRLRELSPGLYQQWLARAATRGF